MRIENDVKMDYSDVLIRPKRSKLSSRKDVDLIREYTFLNSKGKYTGIPIMAANMDNIGTLQVAKILKQHQLTTILHKFHTNESFQSFCTNFGAYESILGHVGVSSGILDADLANLDALLEEQYYINMVNLDVANGYQESYVDKVKAFRDKYPNVILIAGNVATAEQTEELLLAGADIIKVGIGPGSVCTTRIKTGVGYPQLSAVIECADAAHGLGGHIIADGGCTCPGDVAKAFAGGADFVMLGGMLAGHTESGGKMLEINGEKFKQFYGMSSETAMKKHVGGVAEYRASEGKTVQVPFKGDVIETLHDILGGIRSTCTYVGASKLKELTKRTTFIRVIEQENRVFTK
jgi:GMP reductase